MPKATYVFVFSLGVLLAACSLQRTGVPGRGLPSVASDSSSQAEASRLHSFLQSLTPHTFSGAVLVSRNHKLLLAEGYGYARVEKQDPFTLQTISHTAELAKQFTAAAILKLQAQGRLQVDDSLGRFFRDIPADKQGILLKELLTHTSGLPEEVAGAGSPLLKQAFLEEVWKVDLKFPSGGGYLYSHVGYRLLAAVVEEASKTDYEAYLRKELLEPAKMPGTGYVLAQPTKYLLAREQGVQFAQESNLPDYADMAPALWHIIGSSGMLSTGQDIFRWNHLLLEGSLLPEKELRLLWEAREGVPDRASAYGWEVTNSPDSTPLLMHNSRVGNFVSQLLFYPKEKLSVSVLANKANHQVEQLGPQLGRMVLRPQYTPVPMPYGEQKFIRIPQGDEAESLRALTSFVYAEGEVDAQRVLENHYSPSFRQAASEQMHIQVLHQLQSRLSGASLERIGHLWPTYSLTLYASGENTWYRLRVGVEQQAPYKITSIALETTDPL